MAGAQDHGAEAVQDMHRNKKSKLLRIFVEIGFKRKDTYIICGTGLKKLEEKDQTHEQDKCAQAQCRRKSGRLQKV